MFEVLGVIAITLIFGYFALMAFMYAAMCLMGFDEYAPIPGVGFALVGIIICTGWWFVVGTRIGISFAS